MKNYLYKVIIAAIALIFVFELTIGRKFAQIDDITQNFRVYIFKLINSIFYIFIVIK